MVLVDTAVWVNHFRYGNKDLGVLIENNEAAIHPFIINELACGHLHNRVEIFDILSQLPTVKKVEDDEVLVFIENFKLYGIGIGMVDVYLLASALLSGVKIWTYDKKFIDITKDMNLHYDVKGKI